MLISSSPSSVTSRGAAAAEYALILAIVGAGIAVAPQPGSAISSAINTARPDLVRQIYFVCGLVHGVRQSVQAP